jgi:hypothetical protein
VAGALMVTWAFRQHRWIFAALGSLNVLLIAATVLTGAHYMIDVVVTVAMFALSIAAYTAFSQAVSARQARVKVTDRAEFPAATALP